jgi:integrase
VLTETEIDRLLRAASQRRCRAHPLCPSTYTTLFGLLVTTGLRAGEAVALDVQDVDMSNELLEVRVGKFRKARLVPLARSTVAALQRYLRLRRRHGLAPRSDGPLFVSRNGRRFSTRVCWNAFRKIVDRAGIRDRQGRRPRVHDLRHTFAVRRVVAWHREHGDVNQLLSLLSTYLGHVKVASTQVYLHPTLELLAAAGERFESHCAPRARRKAGA